jgi:hypothetical protein
MFVVHQEIKRTANKIFAMVFFLVHGKEQACRASFRCRAHKKRTANNLFTVRPK